MRVMIDTNILISALLFPSQRMDRLLYRITKEHRLVLSSYELAYTPKQPKQGLFEIRDEKDYPVLYSAIVEDVDVFVTGTRILKILT